MKKNLLVIIPCYNEEASIAALLNELHALVLPDIFNLNVVVVNDCSPDNTAAVAAANGAVVLDLPVNLGIGGAMQTGYLYAHQNNFDLAVQMDGDGQHPPQELIKLLNKYSEGTTNVIIGSRFITRQGFQSSVLRRSGIKYLHWINKIFTHKNIYDCTSGFRLFDKKTIAIVANEYPDEYPEPESLVTFLRKGLKVQEVPVVMKERQGGVSSIRHVSQLYYMVKVTIAMFYSLIRK